MAFLGYLRQATASQSRIIGPFILIADASVQTALSLANTNFQVCKNGGSQAAKNSGGATHVGNGKYTTTWDATDTSDVGDLSVSVNVTNVLVWSGNYIVLEEAIYDALFASSATGLLPANVTQWNGSNVASPATAGYPAVTLKVGTGTGEINLSSGKAPATIAVGDLAASSVTASSLATDAVDEIRDGILNRATSSHATAGTVGKAIADAASQAAAANAAIGTPSDLGNGATIAGNLVTIEGQTDDIGANGAGLTAIPTIASVTTVGSVTGAVGSVTGNVGGNVTGSIGSLATQAKADVQAEAEDALVAKGLDHLVSASVAGADVADNSIIAKMVSKSATADWDTFANTTDSAEALRDRGDVAWLTATGFSTLDAAGVRSAVGLASANLDTQLADIPNLSEFNDRTLATASYATAANQTTILNRIGAFAGSGVNTILGFFQALTRSDATNPSDIGGAFTPTTDSLEAIANGVADGVSSIKGADSRDLTEVYDHAGGGGGSGLTGPYVLTITVTDSATSDPIENARVRVWLNSDTESQDTNSDGEVEYAISDAEAWNYAIERYGYASAIGTFTIDGANLDLPVELDPTTRPSHTDPDLSIGYYVTYGVDGKREADVPVTAKLKTWPDGSSGDAFDDGGWTKTSDENAEIAFGSISDGTGLFRGAVYKVTRGDSGRSWDVEVPDSGDFNMDPIAGSP